MRRGVADYLAAFQSQPEHGEQVRDYLKDNGLIRLLVLDEGLQRDIFPH